jgi:hypothetical protein
LNLFIVVFIVFLQFLFLGINDFKVEITYHVFM